MKSNFFIVRYILAVASLVFIILCCPASGSEDISYLTLQRCSESRDGGMILSGPIRCIDGDTYLNGECYHLLYIDEALREMAQRKSYDFDDTDEYEIRNANVEKTFSNIKDSPQSRIYVLINNSYRPDKYLNLVFLIEDSVSDGILSNSRNLPIYLHLERLSHKASGTAEMEMPHKKNWLGERPPSEGKVGLSFEGATVYKVIGHHDRLQEQIQKLDNEVEESDKINQEEKMQSQEREKHVTDRQKKMAENFYEAWKKNNNRELVNRYFLIPIFDVNLSDGIDEREKIRLGSFFEDPNEKKYSKSFAIDVNRPDQNSCLQTAKCELCGGKGDVWSYLGFWTRCPLCQGPNDLHREGLNEKEKMLPDSNYRDSDINKPSK